MFRSEMYDKIKFKTQRKRAVKVLCDGMYRTYLCREGETSGKEEYYPVGKDSLADYPELTLNSNGCLDWVVVILQTASQRICLTNMLLCKAPLPNLMLMRREAGRKVYYVYWKLAGAIKLGKKPTGTARSVLSAIQTMVRHAWGTVVNPSHPVPNPAYKDWEVQYTSGTSASPASFLEAKKNWMNPNYYYSKKHKLFLILYRLLKDIKNTTYSSEEEFIAKIKEIQGMIDYHAKKIGYKNIDQYEFLKDFVDSLGIAATDENGRWIIFPVVANLFK